MKRHLCPTMYWLFSFKDDFLRRKMKRLPHALTYGRPSRGDSAKLTDQCKLSLGDVCSIQVGNGLCFEILPDSLSHK